VRFGKKSKQNSWAVAALSQGRLWDFGGHRRPLQQFHLAIAKRFSGVTRCPVMADLIKAPELKERMKRIPEWELEKKHIERTFEFDDFSDVIDFVNVVSDVAEEE